ncbi:hypothetical protein ACFOGJ_04310 [Marinibaculum pumilum]|uniref:Uncharacterized protein n=1 Tax=Marinibaculum pumilum TaxID=1766165 RepID=A0ABV7KVR2_9PROT
MTRLHDTDRPCALSERMLSAGLVIAISVPGVFAFLASFAIVSGRDTLAPG